MATTVVCTRIGKKLVQHKLQGDGSYGVPQYVGWGTGTTTAAATDTALETAAAEARVSGTLSYVDTVFDDDTYQNVATITCSGSSKTISEAGVFDASTNGNMFMRATFDGIALNVNDSIQFTWQWQLT